MAGLDSVERVGRIELHSAQLGRLASHLELTRKFGGVSWDRTRRATRAADLQSTASPLMLLLHIIKYIPKWLSISLVGINVLPMSLACRTILISGTS